MPRFLSKLFRRKKTSADDDPKKSKKGSSKKVKGKVSEKQPARGSSPHVGASSAHSRLQRPYTTSDTTGRDSNSSRERDVDVTKPKKQYGVMSPQSRSYDDSPEKSKHQTATSPADENTDHSNGHLSHHRLQQFDIQQRDTSGINPGYGTVQPAHHQAVYMMSPELPKQQAAAMDDMNRSDASSSSFNLSTDAEDSEYEQLRRRLGAHPAANISTLDTSTMSAVSLPTTYTTEDESRIFPALQTDDDMTQATAPSTKEPSVSQPLGLLSSRPDPEDEPGRIQIFPMNSETPEDMRAWTLSPPSTQGQASKDPKSAKSASTPPQVFSFQASSNGVQDPVATPKSSSSSNAPTSTTSRNTPGAHRNFTSPKSQASSNTDDFSNHDFANFADFSDFPTTTEIEPWREEKKTEPSSSSSRDFAKEFDAFNVTPTNQFPSSFNQQQQQQQDSSLSELLAQAKNKRRSGGRSSRHSSVSVSSAPAITSSYLRQQHNLRGHSGSSHGDRTERESRLSTEETSVSDIIQSLEATNQSRMKPGGRNSLGTKSVGDTGATSMARAAKERLREKRRRERENNVSMGLQKARSSEMSSSENSDDNEASESWLFDEVTGALGPRGIAADLESLSGRSNRSKNSQGNKSHRSHRSRSHRSKNKSSSRRQHRSSNESIDSRGSRHSRNSKNSRYSHRSTKSFLSQMSEQSRSVANDLLRLEMQLAMVGSQENRDDVPARGGSSVSGMSHGGTSRASRTSRKSLTSHRNHSSSIARRSKSSVVAPPGKLGIILANKADSKGTVVSGVRTSSVLAEKISPGDRIIAIDGEDVSRMTVSEITTIMSRKSDYERILTVLTTPKHVAIGSDAMGNLSSPSTPSNPSPEHHFDSSFQQQQQQQQFRR